MTTSTLTDAQPGTSRTGDVPHDVADVIIEQVAGWLRRSGHAGSTARRTVAALRTNFGALRLLCNAALADGGFPFRLADLRPVRHGAACLSVRVEDMSAGRARSLNGTVSLSSLRDACSGAARGDDRCGSDSPAAGQHAPVGLQERPAPQGGNKATSAGEPGTHASSVAASSGVEAPVVVEDGSDGTKAAGAMAGRRRDHREVYRRRNAAAIAAGYRSYAERRRARRTGVGLQPADR